MPTRLQSYTKTFADRLLAAIAAGTAPWQKPWRPGELVLPANLVTARRYQGNNTILLLITASLKGYTDTRWAGFRQIADAGGKVRKGERGTPITVFRRRRTDDQDLDPTARDADADAGERRPTTFCSVYHVFNLEQTEGLEHLRPPRPPTLAHDCSAVVDQVAVDAHIDIRHATGDSAYYNRRLDFIAMPLREQFRVVCGRGVESTTGAVAVGGGGSCSRRLSPMPVPHSSPWLRFQSPLIEPDVRISRIRLSDGIMPSPTGSSSCAPQGG